MTLHLIFMTQCEKPHVKCLTQTQDSQKSEINVQCASLNVQRIDCYENHLLPEIHFLGVGSRGSSKPRTNSQNGPAQACLALTHTVNNSWEESIHLESLCHRRSTYHDTNECRMGRGCICMSGYLYLNRGLKLNWEIIKADWMQHCNKETQNNKN